MVRRAGTCADKGLESAGQELGRRLSIPVTFWQDHGGCRWLGQLEEADSAFAELVHLRSRRQKESNKRAAHLGFPRVNLSITIFFLL